MLIKRDGYKKAILFPPFCLLIVAWIFVGCVTTSENRTVAEAPVPASIQGIGTRSLAGGMTRVEVVNSKSAPFTAFKLNDPSRVVLDIRGLPGAALPAVIPVNDGNITTIRVERGKAQTTTTRVVVELARALDFETDGSGSVIGLTLKPQQTVRGAQGYRARPEGTEPRVHFKPGTVGLTKVTGIGIQMMDRGKSRLSIATEGRARYDLERKGPKTLVLTLEGAEVSPQLLKSIDGSSMHGAVDRISPTFSTAENRLSLAIFLREMVPFHLDQTDQGIHIDFGPLSLNQPEKRPIAMAASMGGGMGSASPQIIAGGSGQGQSAIPGLKRGKYRGPNMTMDFVNAEVTNVLRLIGEVSNLNIVWGPEVKGKVSMRLRDVPWEQALDLILANNDLGKREEGNIIWVAPKSKIAQIEKEEKRRRQELEAARKKRMEEQKEREKEAQALQPLITEYIPVDFADAEKDILPHIDKIKTDRGSISVDSRTNTIIMTDIASVIQKAKDIVKEFDTPVKQIMIEARIVDASDNFIRDLGIRWNKLEGQRRGNSSTSFGLPPDATTFTKGGDVLGGGSFSTNAPGSWTPNIGLSFGRLTSSMLGALTLDAALALAETEGKTKTISAPKVIAREGTSATISSGDSIIIPATENVASTTLDATLSLTVTPTAVSVNDYITLDVEVTDDQAPTNTRILKKSITTTLMVKSGETVVIGGIYRENEGYDETGAPYLKDIPLLGWLFKAEEKTSSKSELLIFLTPTVLPPPGKTL